MIFLVSVRKASPVFACTHSPPHPLFPPLCRASLLEKPHKGSSQGSSWRGRCWGQKTYKGCSALPACLPACHPATNGATPISSPICLLKARGVGFQIAASPFLKCCWKKKGKVCQSCLSSTTTTTRLQLRRQPSGPKDGDVGPGFSFPLLPYPFSYHWLLWVELSCQAVLLFQI